jgi:type II secretory pathway pseudopilin PulG
VNRLRADDGTSLVELLITIMVAGIIGAALVTSVVTVNRTERTMQAVRDNVDEARISLDRLRIELRGARRVFHDPDGTHLQFWLDRNGDEQIQVEEIVHFALVEPGDGTARLERWTADTPGQRQVIAWNLVPNTPFTYDQPSPRTRLVDVELVVDAGGNRGAEPKTVHTQVRLRNVE